MKRLTITIGIASLTLATGCNPGASEPDDVAPKIKTVIFQGDVDPKFVGDWQTTKATSGLDLHKDGSAKITTAVPSPKGVVRQSLDGTWRVSKSELYLQYTDSQHTVTTIKYPAKLAGSQMTLDQGSGSAMTYIRR